ncbi:MAG: flavin reductase family protein [Clostridiales Family XIII bacterium]|jgi:flavin reductase (DIM6/NTAB) family NADH-FMN oxidoreductase RutF|nr:flavin reductase family protein [Clostridiales Family XIII bacterium]
MKRSIGVKEILFPNPMCVVGAYDEAGKANMAAIAWAGIVASVPPSVGISVRPSRYTHVCIKRRGAFTISVPSLHYLKEADYFGLASGRDADKLAVTGLTAVRGAFVDAPYIEEFPYVLECAVTHSIEIGSHTLFVGEVKDARADAELFDEQGHVDWAAGQIVCYDMSANSYYSVGENVGKAFSVGAGFLQKGGA